MLILMLRNGQGFHIYHQAKVGAFRFYVRPNGVLVQHDNAFLVTDESGQQFPESEAPGSILATRFVEMENDGEIAYLDCRRAGSDRAEIRFDGPLSFHIEQFSGQNRARDERRS